MCVCVLLTVMYTGQGGCALLMRYRLGLVGEVNTSGYSSHKVVHCIHEWRAWRCACVRIYVVIGIGVCVCVCVCVCACVRACVCVIL